jgi:hypothetical protein
VWAVRGQPLEDADVEVASVDEYIVEPGNTLWGITAQVMGEATLWPKVWSFNPEITNPHWIYPGDVIRFYRPTLQLPSIEDTAQTLAAGTAAKKSGKSAAVEVVQTPKSTRKPLPPAPELVRTFATDEEYVESGSITNAVPDRMLLDVGDIVYVTVTDPEVKVKRGSKFISYVTRPEVMADGSTRHVVEMTGVLIAEKVRDDVVRARIDSTIRAIFRGQPVAKVRRPPKVKMEPTSTKKHIGAEIIGVREGGNLIVGTNDFVFINAGREAGVKRGNQFLVFRQSDTITGSDIDDRKKIGVLQAVDVRDTTTTCMVVEAIEELSPGQPVESIRKRKKK